jgi:proline iminopeptidase
MSIHTSKRDPTGSHFSWSHRVNAFVVVLLLSALSGWGVALTLPRGPVTALQSLIVMGGGVLIGLIAGSLLRSRWAMLLVPVVHLAVLEIGRWSSLGPTVDALRLDSAYGILALLLGRGWYALVGLAPMVFGAGVGAMLARGSSRKRGWLHWVPTAVGTVMFAGFAVLIALPARTPPMLGADGAVVPGSLSELRTVPLNGRDQTIMVRAQRTDRPVLLYLSGGPGQSDLPYTRVLLEDLTRDFVLVGWDQRGTGKSYASLEPTSSLTLEGAVEDAIALTTYLRQRFGEDKIYLLGESWGSTLAVLAAQRRPELYHAVIGSGQMVSQRETDRRLYHDLLALAAKTGDQRLESTMRGYGEPPYADIPYANAFVMGYYEQLYQPYVPPRAYVDRLERAGLGPFGVLGSEYNLIEKVNVLRGLIDMFTVLYPQLQRIDFRRDVPRLEVPVYMLDGAAELRSRRDLALEWFEQLEAPIKRRFTFENAGHSVVFEQYEAFGRIMREVIVPQTDSRLEE